MKVLILYSAPYENLGSERPARLARIFLSLSLPWSAYVHVLVFIPSTRVYG